MSNKILAYKGFDKDFECMDYSFEVGKKYTQDGKIVVCKNGFNACEYPLDVFNYYDPTDSKFAIVELSGEISRKSDGDSKIAASNIYIKTEIKIQELVSCAITYIMNNINPDTKKSSSNTGDYSASTVEGIDSIAIATGNQSKARASIGSAIVICYRNIDYKLIHIKSAIIDGVILKANTFYTLDCDGNFAEAG